MWQPLSWSSLVVVYSPLFAAHHNPIEKWFIVVAYKKRRWHFKMKFLFQSVRKAPTYLCFHLSDLLQMPNHRMVNAEFLGNFSCSCKRIRFLVNFWWQVTALLIFKFLISFAKLLESPLLCMFISSSWTKCIVDVASCLHYSRTQFELK